MSGEVGKSMSVSSDDFKKQESQVKYILLLAGICTVLPWNFFMSAYDYYSAL